VANRVCNIRVHGFGRRTCRYELRVRDEMILERISNKFNVGWVDVMHGGNWAVCISVLLNARFSIKRVEFTDSTSDLLNFFYQELAPRGHVTCLHRIYATRAESAVK
jgi:hypothetical protein